jgi:hypothetical protein
MDISPWLIKIILDRRCQSSPASWKILFNNESIEGWAIYLFEGRLTGNLAQEDHGALSA